jgi:hypothetical protein
MLKSKISFVPIPKSFGYSLIADGKEIRPDHLNYIRIDSDLAAQLTVRKIPSASNIKVNRMINGISFEINLRKFKGTDFHVTICGFEKLNKKMSDTEYYDCFLKAKSVQEFVFMVVPHAGFERPEGFSFHFKAESVQDILFICDKIMNDLVSELK